MPKKAPARPRGRPPKPGGPAPRADVQRAYRARLAAAGKVVRIVDVNAVPDFDPEKDGVFERAVIAKTRDKLRNALSVLDFLKDEVARLRQLNDVIEGERKQLEWQITNLTKDKTVLRQELASLRNQQKPVRRR